MAWFIPIIIAAAQAAQAAQKSMADRSASERDIAATTDIAKLNNAADLQQALAQIASNESMANPFRGQNAQAQSLANLDELERGVYTPARLDVSGSPYASYVPQMSGGYSYTKSPELMASAGALKTNVMAGNTAPTMTNAANYGQTGVMDLLAVLAGRQPATTGTSGVTSQLRRRAPGAAGTAVGRREGLGPNDDYWRARQLPYYEDELAGRRF
jgi:hypothetical protein